MRLLSLLFLLALCGQVVGQRVAWEHRLEKEDDDLLTDVCRAKNGIYIACGTRWAWGQLLGREIIPAIVVVGVDEQGDTLFVRPTGYYGYSPRLCALPGDTLFCLMATTDRIGFAPQLYLLHLNSWGDVRKHVEIANTDSIQPFVARLSALDDASLLAVGYISTSQSDYMYVIRLDTSGLIYFQKRFSDNNPSMSGNWIEPTPRGTYLASGTAGFQDMGCGDRQPG